MTPSARTFSGVNSKYFQGSIQPWSKGSSEPGFSSIIGYFTIPTVAGWIIQAGGGMGAYGRHINSVGMQGGSAVAGVAGSVTGNIAGRAGKLLK